MRILRVLIFIAILGMLVLCIQPAFGIAEYSFYSIEHGLKKEKKNSLDAVFIGSSNVLHYFEPPLAWKDYGIAVYSYAIASMSYRSLKYRVIEARKTQPDALFIICVNCFQKENSSTDALHRNLDYMPLSWNKLEMTRVLCDSADLKLQDRLEYYLPIIRFHSRWPELTHFNFARSVNGLKGGRIYDKFLEVITDMSGELKEPADNPLPENRAEVLDELLDYLEDKHVNALFVTVPQRLDASLQGELQDANRIIQERGFPCLNLVGQEAEMGVQLNQDYSDKGHFNVHGAVKFTNFFASYLVEHYGFSDKRGQKGWESWDDSVGLYAAKINEYVLPLELTHELRDYSLEMPHLSQPEVNGSTIKLTWTETDGADGYMVYRKLTGDTSPWECVYAEEGAETEFTDESPAYNTTYKYTVVPFRTDETDVYYGDFDCAGVSGKTEGE